VRTSGPSTVVTTTSSRVRATRTDAVRVARHTAGMDPTVRLLQLAALLQRRQDWTSAALAAELGVTDRTVRRDISRLRELGYAVDSAPGPEGGYRLRAGSALPPLVLTDDEAVVLAVGLRTAALSGLSGSTATAVSALAKLEELLPTRLRARVAALGADVVSLTDPRGRGADPAVLATLAVACRRGEQVALAYTDARGVATHRDVAPYRIVHAEQRWYLVAHDLTREAWRTFRVDRISAAEPRGGRVSFAEEPDAAAMVAEAITAAVYRLVATVRLDAPVAWARRAVPPTVGQVTPDGPHSCLLRIGADDLDWLARELVGLTCGFEVIDPPELVTALQELGRQLSRTTGRVERRRDATDPDRRVD
jgi:predicted DNA-binding transcriptional regulator YafY